MSSPFTFRYTLSQPLFVWHLPFLAGGPNASLGGGLMGENMDVSKNRGTPKWMVKIMENLIKMG